MSETPLRRVLDGLPPDSSAIAEHEALLEVERVARIFADEHFASPLGTGLAKLDEVRNGEPPDPDDDVVLGCCPHGVNLDREFCPKGCRV